MPDEIPFEQLYAEAGADFASIPWAHLAPNAQLLEWLGALPPPASGDRGLVVVCGLGDDAEELARRGLTTTAFDLSQTAIARARERFPHTTVDYSVQNVFALPGVYRRAFDVVVEIRTLQSLVPGTREPAAAAIGNTVAPGGRLFVLAYGRHDDHIPDRRPWPVTTRELEALGLRQLDLADEPINDAGDRTWTIDYTRPR